MTPENPQIHCYRNEPCKFTKKKYSKKWREHACGLVY